HAGWGHGCVDDSVALAIAANVKRLFLFHHDPDRTDKELDKLLKHAQAIARAVKPKLKVDLAREGTIIRLP
ncbi:MAG: MBL fold metallo-hydrolase, partial [Limisphaerales bacterium]